MIADPTQYAAGPALRVDVVEPRHLGEPVHAAARSAARSEPAKSHDFLRRTSKSSSIKTSPAPNVNKSSISQYELPILVIDQFAFELVGGFAEDSHRNSVYCLYDVRGDLGAKIRPEA